MNGQWITPRRFSVHAAPQARARACIRQLRGLQRSNGVDYAASRCSETEPPYKLSKRSDGHQPRGHPPAPGHYSVCVLSLRDFKTSSAVLRRHLLASVHVPLCSRGHWQHLGSDGFVACGCSAGCEAVPPAASPQCSLLGHLVGGRCLCDKGWTGTTCAVADLKPLDLTLGYDNVSSATWGGRPVEDPKTGIWSLIVSQFSNKCPLAMWTNNSQVVRAVSSVGPAGPYEFAEVVYPEFHHNPSGAQRAAVPIALDGLKNC